MKLIYRKNLIYCFVCLWIAQFCFASQAEDLRLVLKSGTSLKFVAEPHEFEWTTVDAKGQLKKRFVKLKDVAQLELVDLPSSDQVAKIRQLLNELGNTDYHVREAAEEALKDEKLGGTYLSLIKQFKGNGPLEVRYRVERIIAHLESESEEEAKPASFDKLVLRSGESLTGDAGHWVIKGNYRDTKISIGREALRRIEIASENDTKIPALDAAVEPVSTRLIYLPDDEFFLPSQTTIDFETDSNGFELRNRADVTDSYLAKGLKLGKEGEGFIGISGFPFKFPDYPIPKENSICVFDTSGRYDTRFKGVATFSFCMPGQPNVPAGVHEFGLYAGRIAHSRDLILEAYNSDGHLLATVEATDTQLVFLGAKSNELITHVRVLSNPYLYRLDRATDSDYAMDNVCFSSPVPIINDGNNQKNVVRLENGDVMVANQIDAKTSGQLGLTVDAISETLTVSLDEVASINFAATDANGADADSKDDENGTNETPKPVSQKPAEFLAILKDRSLIQVEPGIEFASSLFSGLKFKPENLAGLTSTSEPVRYPALTDFEEAEHVLVFPTCRIATSNLKFSMVGFSWNESDEKILQLVNIHVFDPTDENKKEEPEDPTPQHTSVDYGKTSPADVPTVWFAPPQIRPNGTGLLRLKDGQQIVLGGNSEFKVVGNSENGLVIGVNEIQADVAWSNIKSVDFPAVQQ